MKTLSRLRLAAALALACALSASADNIAYLTTTGDDGTAALNDSSLPFGTLQSAVAALGADGGTVSVAAGTYAFTSAVTPDALQSDNYTAGSSCIYITTPVDIVGATGNPADVVFKRDNAAGSARVFMIDHADAKLRFATIQDGYPSESTPRNGGNILIGYAGGTVEDCIIKDGRAANGNNTNLGGGNISLMNGRCSRCVITGGKIIHYRPIGMNVMAAGDSVVENCLITKGACNTTHEAAQDEGAVALKDRAKLVNCSVVDNTANRFAGVNILSANARAINCVICGNTVRYETDARDNANDGWANGVSKNNSNLGCYVNCATDLDTSRYPQLNSTCLTVTREDFIDPDNGNWRLRSSSAAVNTGSDYSQTGATSTTDLDGNSRTSDGAVDIGCYQSQPAFDVRYSASSLSGVIPNSSEITFTATAFHPASTVTYTWNFGDGSTSLVTTETNVAHDYANPGSYTVSVSATDGVETLPFTFPNAIVISGFSCEFAMLTTNVMIGTEASFRAENLVASSTPTFTWNFGDGSPAVSTNGIEITHVYQTAGSYTVSVEADAGAEGAIAYTFDTTVDVIQRDLYVNASGSGTFPFDTAEKGAKTPDVAVQFAAEECVIHVRPGNYDMRNKDLNVMRGVRMIGEGDTPEGVVFKGYGTNNGKRNIRVEHENAWVENLTLDGGFADYATGGNLYLASGTVTNCVLRNGRSNSSGGGGGGVFIKGGVLTHCVVTNSYLGNRGNGIVLQQTGGRVSNCLLGYNKLEWLQSRNAFSLVNITGGSMDNCTIVGARILKYDAEWPAQMNNTSDKGVNVGANASVTNVVIADLHYISHSETDRATILADSVSTWAGTAANFVNCVTDDASPINETCHVGTTATMFADYATGDLMPKMGGALFNKGVSLEAGVPSVDLAGNPRVGGSAIDVGAYECQVDPSIVILFR